MALQTLHQLLIPSHPILVSACFLGDQYLGTTSPNDMASILSRYSILSIQSAPSILAHSDSRLWVPTYGNHNSRLLDIP